MRGAAWTRVAAGVVSAVTLAGCTAAPSPAPAGTSAAPRAGEAAIELQQFDFGGDFALGVAPHRFTLAEHRGEVVLLFFGYTYCPDICPTTLGTIARAQDLLGADRERTFAAFVSVDPQRDTPARLAEYTRHFGIRGTGVTGNKAEIDALVAQYSAYYEIQPSASALGYMVDHTSRIFLIDGAGKVRYLFRSTDRPETIAAGIRTLLASPVS
jgi:protein SCO1/2